MNEIYNFYNNGAEIGRLERGLGIVEFHRTKEILLRYVDKGKVVYDIGGGIGMYAAWLAKKGNEVHLIELAESAVEYAKANMMQDCRFVAETGNALQVNRPDESADVVLLMGPLYHLRDREERLQALREALRMLKKRRPLGGGGHLQVQFYDLGFVGVWREEKFITYGLL